MDDTLKTSAEHAVAVERVNKILGCIKPKRENDTGTIIINSCPPPHGKDTAEMKNVLRKATSMVRGRKTLPSEERCKRLGILCLERK